ncbi:hypothetical protein L596_013901 [Steinernema carpocapsae]|uniref:Uncharacterized protein n=1 Tax=Steinernema carpocapsae TaxID=34508 RepID=A0A4U5P2B5_STECR|nr:hypothetical protein L596_013901 [Steinernema carpocapsae]
MCQTSPSSKSRRASIANKSASKYTCDQAPAEQFEEAAHGSKASTKKAKTAKLKSCKLPPGGQIASGEATQKMRSRMRIDSIKLQGLFSYVLHGLTSTNLPDKARKPLAKCQESLRSRGRLHSIDEKGNNREAECVMQTPEQADK